MPMSMKDKKKIKEQKSANESKHVFANGSEAKLDTGSLASSLPKTGKGAIKSDVLGSYTGTDIDYSAPVQDADDL